MGKIHYEVFREGKWSWKVYIFKAKTQAYSEQVISSGNESHTSGMSGILFPISKSIILWTIPSTGPCKNTQMLECCVQLWCCGKGRSRCRFCQLLWQPTQPICWIPQQERTTSWNRNWKIRKHLQSKFNYLFYERSKVFSPRLLKEEEYDSLCHTYVTFYSDTKIAIIQKTKFLQLHERGIDDQFCSYVNHRFSPATRY